MKFIEKNAYKGSITRIIQTCLHSQKFLLKTNWSAWKESSSGILLTLHPFIIFFTWVKDSLLRIKDEFMRWHRKLLQKQLIDETISLSNRKKSPSNINITNIMETNLDRSPAAMINISTKQVKSWQINQQFNKMYNRELQTKFQSLC